MMIRSITPLLLIALLISGCNNMKEPAFRRIDSFRLKNISLTQGTIGFNVVYYNPNNFGVSVKETEANVYIDSVYIGKFRQDSLINVGQQSEFTIPISGSIPIGKLLEMNYQNLSNREILIKADGDTKIGKLGVFVTKPFQYQGKHKLGSFKL